MSQLPSLRPSGSTLWELLGAFVGTRLLIAVVGVLADTVLYWEGGRPESRQVESVLDLSRRWDVGWYMSIAGGGYAYDPDQASNVVFFPLFPMLTRLVSALTGDDYLAGLLVSNLSLFVAVVLLHILAVREGLGADGARRAALLLLCFPASIFHSNAYTEGLFLALATGGLLAMRERRWWLTGLLGFLLALTRTSGVLFLAPVLVELWGARTEPRRSDEPRTWLARSAAVLLPPVGTLSYFGFLWLRFGDPLLVFKAEKAWNRRLEPVWVAINDAWHHAPFYTFAFLAAPLFLACAVAFLATRRFPKSFVVYALVMLIYTLSSGKAEATPRLVSVAVPMYLAWAAIGREHPLLFELLLISSSAFLALFAALFACGYWMT